jgi:hypothetical protein
MSDISGNAQYDAATANWGGGWRMPTYDELNELIDRCTWTWTTQNGVNGYNVEGPSGASIFLPAAGHRNGSSLGDAGSFGYYWSSSPIAGYDNNAYNLNFNSGDANMNNNNRANGYSVRCVQNLLLCLFCAYSVRKDRRYIALWHTLTKKWLFFRQGPPKINQIVLKPVHLDKELPDFLSWCGN